MSTDISPSVVAISAGRNISLSDVNNGRVENEDLAAHIQRVRAEKGFSQRDVERNSGTLNGKPGISKGYIGQIENREVLGHSVTPQKLRALARGLQESEDIIFAVARGKPLAPMSPTDFQSAIEAMGVEQFQAYGGVENLTDEDRQEIIAMIETLIEQKLIRRQKSGGTGKKKR